MLYRGLAGAALALTLAHCVAEPSALEVASTSQEVIFGTEVVAGDYPWLVNTGGCTGALISPSYVLTAAHCYGYRERNAEGTLVGIEFSSGPVTIGHPDLDDPEATQHVVAEVLLHPEYIPLTRDEVWGLEPWDIALLRLEEPVVLQDYLRLPTRQPEEGELVRVAGWGLTEDGRVRHAREAVLEVRPRDSCFAGDAKRFCSRGGPDSRRSNVGSGDSGGPAFVDVGDGYMSLGINSTSSGQTLNTFASHAATFAFMDWVLEVTEGELFCPEGDPANGCAALLDECALGFAACDANASCEDTELGFDCLCAEGFAGDGLSCEDVDECAEGTSGCSPDAFCTNEVGSFSCTCAPGFLGDGVSCEPDPALAGGCHAGAGATPLAGLILFGLFAARRRRA
ncbi:MAG: trypsin-like serine protease [Myxococcota bacterium]